MNQNIFNSKTDIIPPVRRDLQIIPVEDNGRDLLLFYDTMKISEPGFALDRSVEPILSLLDGRKTLRQLTAYFGEDVAEDNILSFIKMLDKQLLLESDYFRKKAENIELKFEDSDIRRPALADSIYPSDPSEYSAFIDNLLKKASDETNAFNTEPKKALYAPHIDLRVGATQYAEAFSTLKVLQPKRVVILATSHYSGYYPQLYTGFPYVGSTKSFEVPGRTFKTDQTAINYLSDFGSEIGFTTRDRAHRIEHSIETHLLFAGHLWPHDFEIVPILVGGIDEIFYKQDGEMGTKISAFSDALRVLDTDDTFYLISGDLSHIGKKFGDSVPASSMRSTVESFDKTFMHAAVENNSEKMITHISEDYDPYRVCGFPPLYTFMQSFPDLKGRSLNYHWWDEQERESAVSFGSIAY
ncbi:AmmeMemoRadiSam system protein B [Rhodohalobacter sp. 8-1]|uniref:AmmeMemoRadiSam system protein B n=1 Tax=Rhodohalobacter sp. 8-1 TaxID=3131972 RepID=UPI0030EC0704